MIGRVRSFGCFVLAISFASFFCLVLFFVDNKYYDSGSQSFDGVLKISEGDLEEYPISHLVKGWAFYPDVLLEPDDFTGGFPDSYMVYTDIGDRVRFDLTGDKDNPHGSGSYFLRLVLPETLQSYALELPEIYSAYKLYVGGRLLLEMGNSEPKAYVPRTQNRMVTFDASGDTSILLAVSDYSHFYSGLVYPPAFGTPFAVEMVRSLRMGVSLFINTLTILSGALSLYFGLRMKHQNAILFSVLCVTMCIFSSYGITHTILQLPVFPWYTLEMVSGYLFSLLTIVLHNRICNVDLFISRVSVGIATVFCFLATFYGLFSPYLTVPIMNSFSTLIFIFKSMVAIYLLVTAFMALKDTNRQSAPLFFSSVVYGTTFVWDRILPSYEPILGGWFVQWGSLALVIAIGYTLWRDITSTYSNSLVFAEEHRLMARQLAMQTEYLRLIKAHDEENQRLRHDFRHHVQIIKGLANSDNQSRELVKYLEKVERSSNSGDIVYSGNFCDNVAVNALLQYYSFVATQQLIKTDFQVIIPPNIAISDVDLCSVLGNLLENAVDACVQQFEGDKYIYISSSLIDKTLFILIENSCDGNYRRKDGRFLSMKSEGLRFGIGLESARHTLEEYSGSLTVFPLQSKFRVGISISLCSSKK